MEPLSDIERPVAVIGANDTFQLEGLPGVMTTSLSAETAIRSGFDVFLVEPPGGRREARDLLRLAEEAGVRVGFPRWLRRQKVQAGAYSLVSIVANVECGLDHLLDLAMWLSGCGGVQRLEAEASGGCSSVVLVGHGAQIMAIQTTRAIEGLRVSVEGGSGKALVEDLVYDAEDGLGRELRLFASGSADSVFLEDSVDLVSLLERVSARVR
jgi:hypothetical protein